MSNALLDKFEEFKTIVGYIFEYEFETGGTVSFKLKQTDFPHLIGLHKLIDLPIIQAFNDISRPDYSAKYILSQIKKERYLKNQNKWKLK